MSHEAFKSMNKYEQKIKKLDKNMVVSRDYQDIDFPVSRKSYHQIETKNNISIMYLDIKIRKRIQFIDQKKKFQNLMKIKKQSIFR